MAKPVYLTQQSLGSQLNETISWLVRYTAVLIVACVISFAFGYNYGKGGGNGGPDPSECTEGSGIQCVGAPAYHR
jgi:hypothetical protein